MFLWSNISLLCVDAVCMCSNLWICLLYVGVLLSHFYCALCTCVSFTSCTCMPLNVSHCVQCTVTVCLWEPLMLLGQCGAVCRNKCVFRGMFVHMTCACIPAPQRGGWGQRGWEWWAMPEVVFYQPLRWLAGSLMASSVGWLTDLLALSGSFFHIW